MFIDFPSNEVPKEFREEVAVTGTSLKNGGGVTHHTHTPSQSLSIV
jgi:hypothetical protein